MNYKPYSPEWTRKRYLNESIQNYFDNDIPVGIIINDLKDILEDNIQHYKSKTEKLEKVLSELNSI
jgi:cell fate (sporulation/competence/biofilm development) regulator YlbF (YheA/YmcA/DUF963 family)